MSATNSLPSQWPLVCRAIQSPALIPTRRQNSLLDSPATGQSHWNCSHAITSRPFAGWRGIGFQPLDKRVFVRRFPHHKTAAEWRQDRGLPAVPCHLRDDSFVPINSISRGIENDAPSLVRVSDAQQFLRQRSAVFLAALFREQHERLRQLVGCRSHHSAPFRLLETPRQETSAETAASESHTPSFCSPAISCLPLYPGHPRCSESPP